MNTSVDPFVTPTIFHKFSEDNRGIDPIYTYIRDGGLTEETVGIMGSTENFAWKNGIGQFEAALKSWVCAVSKPVHHGTVLREEDFEPGGGLHLARNFDNSGRGGRVNCKVNFPKFKPKIEGCALQAFT